MTASPRTATPARLAALAALLGLASLLVAPPSLGGVARAMGPLPACRYDDVLTTPRGYADWSITLVDTILRVPKTYVPPDLVSTSRAGISGGSQIRALVINDLRAMQKAAAAAGAGIAVQSAYRSYAEQKTVFDGWVEAYGYDRALEVSARPGHSEHQLGLAIDFRSDPGGSPFGTSWGTTPAGKWMNAHAWEYGFLMSYPKGSMALTCYDYEPWHFRYVGRELAALVHASGMTPREYLWANFTTTVVPPPPRPSGRPASTAGSSGAPLPSAIASPSPGPSLPSAAPTEAATPEGSVTPAPPGTPAPRPTDSPTTAPTFAAAPALLVGVALGVVAVAIGIAVVMRRGRSGIGL